MYITWVKWFNSGNMPSVVGSIMVVCVLMYCALLHCMGDFERHTDEHAT